jgi:hypothetical protein
MNVFAFSISPSAFAQHCNSTMALTPDSGNAAAMTQDHHRSALPKSYWTLIVVGILASAFVFGTCIVNTPSFDSARIAAASIASGSAKVREKLP